MPFLAVLLLGVACGPGSGGADQTNNEQGEEFACGEVEFDSCTALTSDAEVSGGVTLDEPCYRVDDVVDVSEGTLEIAAGTQFYFGEDAGIGVEEGATLVARGSEDQPVCMQGAQSDRGFWRGLRFSRSPQSRLENVVVEHAGSESWTTRRKEQNHGAVILHGAETELTVTGSTFRDNEQSAITAYHSSGSTLNLDSSRFEQNATPIRLDANVADGLEGDLVFSDNDLDRVVLDSPGVQGLVDDVQLVALDVPYLVDSRFNIEEHTLEIAAGATLEFVEDDGIEVTESGALTAVGDQDEPIHFRGQEETRGFWRGLRFDTDSERNRLEYAVVEHAGSEPWTTRRQARNQGAVIVVGSESNLNIADSTFRQNQHAAIIATDSPHTTVPVMASTFEDNERAVVVQARQIPNLAPDLQIESNDIDAVVLEAGSPNNDIEGQHVWQAMPVPYRVATGLRIEDGGVEVAPGTVFEFEEEQGIRVEDATLAAEGEEEAPIIFQGTEDEAGHWAGIYFRADMSGGNKLDHVEVHHGGGHQWDPGRVSSQGNIVLSMATAGCGAEATVSISNASITKSAMHGIAIRWGSFVLGCSGNEFSDIAGDDVFDSEGDGCYCETGCECGQ
ncbi:MAG: hypothetical protein ACLFVJ_04475 [Persicimonas sp.]